MERQFAGIITGRGRKRYRAADWISSKPRFALPAMLLALPVARLLAPLRTSVLVPLVGVLAVATTWFGLYLTIIARWTP